MVSVTSVRSSFWEHFLASDPTRHFKFMSYFPCHSPGFFQGRRVFRNQGPGLRIVFGIGLLLFLSPLRARAYMSVRVHARTCVHTHTSLYLCQSLYNEKHPFIPILPIPIQCHNVNCNFLFLSILISFSVGISRYS